MKIYHVLRCDCDGGRLGKADKEWFYMSETEALEKLYELVLEHNTEEKRRKNKKYPTLDNDWSLYHKYDLHGVEGYACWAYTTFLYMKVEDLVVPSKKQNNVEYAIEKTYGNF